MLKRPEKQFKHLVKMVHWGIRLSCEINKGTIVIWQFIKSYQNQIKSDTEIMGLQTTFLSTECKKTDKGEDKGRNSLRNNKTWNPLIDTTWQVIS